MRYAFVIGCYYWREIIRAATARLYLQAYTCPRSDTFQLQEATALSIVYKDQAHAPSCSFVGWLLFL